MEHQLLHSSATKYDQDLGVLLSEYSNSEYKFNLWYILILLIPIIGIIIFLILLINFLLSRYPSKTYQLYENGFVVKNKKNRIVKTVMYDNIEFVVRKNTKIYMYGFYNVTRYEIALKNAANKSLFSFYTKCRNEKELPEKNNGAVIFINDLEKSCGLYLINRIKQVFNKEGLVRLKDEGITIGKGYITDKNNFTFYNYDISQYKHIEYSLFLYHKDYQEKMFKSQGHRVCLNLETNMILKLYVLRNMLGLNI